MEDILMTDMVLNIEDLHAVCNTMLKSVVTVCESCGIPYFLIYGSLLGAVRHNGPIPWDSDIDIYVPEYEIERFVNTIEDKLGEKYWVNFRNKGSVPKPFPRIGLKGYSTDILHIDVFRMSGLPHGFLRPQLMEICGRFLWILWRAKTIDPKTEYSDSKRTIYAYAMKLFSAPFSVSFIIRSIDYLCKKYKTYSTDYVGRVMGHGAIYKKSLFESYVMFPYADFFVRVPTGYDELLRTMYGDYMQFPPEEERRRNEQAIFQIHSINLS